MFQVNSLSSHTYGHAPSLRLDYREGNLRRLGKAERLSSGALRLKANMTRTGVLEYDTGDEYRPESEVFAPESLASLRSAPVVVGHPPSGEVTLDTWKELAVGHVESVYRDGQFVSGTIIINDPDTIDMLEGGELSELSPGYTAKMEWGAGKGPDGKPFASTQRLIRYNHLALLPDGMGRSGREVRVRTDSVSLRQRAIAVLGSEREADAFSRELGQLAALAKAAGWGETSNRSDAVPFSLTAEEVQALMRLARIPQVQVIALQGAARRERDEQQALNERGETPKASSRVDESDSDDAWLRRKIAGR